VSTALALVLGLAIGLRHAFEPDHLAAVSTLVGETHGPRHGALLGVTWGIGHTVSLVAVGVVLTLVGATLPPRAEVAFELTVAAMLLVLGIRSIVVATRRRQVHVHPHAPASRRWWRPLVVGIVHGLAGSGALTALVFAQLPDTGARLLYMLVFGIGSIAGMAIASAVAGAALQRVGSPGIRRGLGFATGVVSIVVGLAWGIPLLS
jgi:hypothetical protein